VLVPDLFFILFALLTLVTAICVVLLRNPVLCALSLVGSLASSAAIFVLLEAYTLAVFQILLYAGAVTVLFVFVIMVFQFTQLELQLPEMRPLKFTALLLSASIGLFLSWTWWSQPITATKGPHSPAAIIEAGGDVQAVSQYLFSAYALPFEVASLILLIAIIGSVIIAKKREEDQPESEMVTPAPPEGSL